MTKYAELRLRIDRGVGRGSYRIVATGPAGEALGRFKLPFSEMELENFILKVGATRRGRRRIDSPEMELAKSFGTKLFGALFEGDVRELYRSSFSETRSAGQGLRVTLSLTGAPELLQVPWEYMYDHPSFLSISTWTPIVRYLDLPKPRRPLQVALPIRILAMVSSPNDAEPIDSRQERTKLEAALGPLIESGAIAIDWLEEASLRALQRQLRRGDYHVFHFIGHGGYDQEADDGVLLFQDEVGRGRRVSGIQLGTILADEVSLRLAVLNSCEGARSSLQDPFSGVATSLIEREIPAVIGMQFEITDRAAIVFAGEFYSALADGLPVDSSVAEARKAIYADQNDIEWGTPVLFMRVADGRLFDVQAHAPVRAAETSAPTRSAAATPLGGSEPFATAEPATAPQRVEQDRATRESAEGAERQRADAESARIAADRIEADRLEMERLEAERIDIERAEQELRARDAAEQVSSRDARATHEPDDAAWHGATVAAPAADTQAADNAGAHAESDEAAASHDAVAAEVAKVAASPLAAKADIAPPLAGTGVAIGRDEPQTSAATIDDTTLPPTPISDESRAGKADTDAGFSVAWTAARAALGSLAGVAIGWVFVWLVEPSLFEGASARELLAGFINEAFLTILTITAAVTIAESALPALRIPGGPIYRFIGGRRLAASAIEGLVAGASVGWLTSVVYYLSKDDDSQLKVESLVVHTAFAAAGFVIAEAVIHSFRRRRSTP